MSIDLSSPEIRVEREGIDHTVLDLSCVGDELAATKALFMQSDPANEGLGKASAAYDEQSRGTKRAGMGAQDHMADYVNQLVSQALQQPDGTDIPTFIRSSLQPYIVALHGSANNGQIYLDMLAGLTMEALRLVQSLDALSSSATAKLYEVIGNDETEQYKLMRILSRRIFKANGVPEEDLEHSMLQGMFAFQSLKSGEKSIAPVIVKRLEEGGFDSFIASDLLHEANETEDQGPLSELTDLIRLVSSVSGKDVDEVISRLSTTEELSRWPLHYRRLFETRRREYVHSLDYNYKVIRDYFSEEVLLPWDNSLKPIEEVIQAAIKASRASAARLRSGHPANAHIDRKARLSAVREGGGPAKKRRHQQDLGASALNGAQEGLSRGEEDKPPQLNELYCCKGLGEETFQEGTFEFREYIGDYINSHLGEPELAKDVRNLLDYLRKLDLSSGLPRGIKKFQTSAKDARKTPGTKIYELKPSGRDGIVGVSTRAEITDKLRILFTRTSTTVIILGITDKDELPALQKRLGIPGRSRTGRSK